MIRSMQDIRKRKVPLTETLMSDPDYILQHVQQENLITRREYTNIRSVQRSSEGRVIDLLDKVMDKGEETCRRFLSLLQQPEVQDTFPPLKKLCSGEFTDNPIQETQNAALSEYRMSSLPRGHCLIFNNQHFETESLKERKGSYQDAEALEKVFSWLGFRVHVLQDQPVQEMRSQLQQFSRVEHSDCFVCCVLSHGAEQGIYGRDGALLRIQDVLSPFNGANCPSLANKPKVFFIQACQGKRVQEAVAVHADCPGGHRPGDGCRRNSWLHPSCGFRLPRRHGHRSGMRLYQTQRQWQLVHPGPLPRADPQGCLRGEDILTILTRVNEEVSRREGDLCSQYGPQLAKQMPDPRFTLRKRLVFPVPSISSPTL
ncbi:hypothetical protein ANANG_G00281240 [Anguilla anguilla]|uniref:Caspase-8 n=1 Tax=Anguilla anguilla TaxID=7936 RepID=A0A9D3RKJ5_ANGAN|nr:hypothetical protein ANANG_G00281240 [Anguilla anguilla]